MVIFYYLKLVIPLFPLQSSKDACIILQQLSFWQTRRTSSIFLLVLLASMPRKCSIVGCKSNYESERLATKVHLFPKDSVEQKRWKKTLPKILEVHQERMLRCLAEVVPAVLHASSHSDAIMLAFGPSLLSLDQAVLLEFADTSEFEAEQAHDEDDKENYSSDEDADGDESDDDLEVGAASRQQRQLVFSRLLGVSGLADAIPLTSMHVLLRMPRTSAAKTPPSAPFRPRPHFRLRPACKLTRLTLPCGRSRSATSKSASASANDSMWYHSATPVPGYALSEQG
uniref:THAP-type domain-containing protein n=1 Tax=Macrostomum lignano TaxID=282301 RepID=A0A1I8HEG1_9PLAT